MGKKYIAYGSNMNIEQMSRRCPNAKIIGKSFEVYEMENSQFALARKEVKTGIGHKEFEIKTGEDITIEEDLARRDITINAIAKNVLTRRNSRSIQWTKRYTK